MNDGNARPHSAIAKLELDTKEQRHVPLCLSSVEEEKNLNLWSPVLEDVT